MSSASNLRRIGLLAYRLMGRAYRLPHVNYASQVSDPSVVTVSIAPAQPAKPPQKRGIWGALVTVATLLATKAKAALLLLKFAGLGKFALTGFSMALMVWVEARLGGLPFGLGFVLLIFIHELGHGYAIRKAGLRSGWPVFIPFFGALISLKEMPKSRQMEAEIAYGGPLFGTIASLACGALYLVTDLRLFLSLAYTGFFLNLFNLVPIRPLDGGRVAQIFSKRAWILGGSMLGAMFFATRAPQLLLIGVMAAMNAFGRHRGRAEELPAASSREQTAWGLRYFGLCLLLGALIYFSGQSLHGAE